MFIEMNKLYIILYNLPYHFSGDPEEPVPSVNTLLHQMVVQMVRNIFIKFV